MKMKRVQIIVATLISVMILFSACAPQTAPAPAPAPAAAPQMPAPAPAAAPAKAAWEVEWDKTLAAAKAEGRIVIFSSTARIREALVEGFRKRYGIQVESLAASASEITAKLLREQRAGIYSLDVYVGGTSYPVVMMKPKGAVVPLEGWLILPELTDPDLIKKIWWEGKISWVDEDHTTIVYIADEKNPITINTDLVKPGEIKSYQDLLNPKWKGKIALRDVTQAGGQKWFGVVLATGILDENYMRQLAKQEPTMVRDSRMHAEWVSRGKFPIAIAADPATLVEFVALGLPIQGLKPAEGTYVSASHGGVAGLKNTPHPNAAKVFVNWLLTKEGQTIFARATGGQSGREDVPTDHLQPNEIRRPGMQLFNAETEKIQIQVVEYTNLGKEIFWQFMEKGR